MSMTLEIVAGRIAELEKQMEAVMAKMEIVLDDSSSKAMKLSAKGTT